MIELPIRSDHIQRAQAMASDMGILRNSITSGDGNVAGFIGEIVLAEHFGYSQTNTYDYDIVSGDGKRIDVKTKRTTVVPLPYYECSIAAYNTTQNCDYYFFNRVHVDQNRLWFLGMIEKERYFQIARFLQKGQKDGDNNFVVKADCYNLRIDSLWAETIRIADQWWKN